MGGDGSALRQECLNGNQEAIVLPSDTAAIFRVRDRAGSKNAARSVCGGDAGGKGKSPSTKLEEKQWSFMRTFPVETSEDVHHSAASTGHFVHLRGTTGPPRCRGGIRDGIQGSRKHAEWLRPPKQRSHALADAHEQRLVEVSLHFL